MRPAASHQPPAALGRVAGGAAGRPDPGAAEAAGAEIPPRRSARRAAASSLAATSSSVPRWLRPGARHVGSGWWRAGLQGQRRVDGAPIDVTRCLRDGRSDERVAESNLDRVEVSEPRRGSGLECIHPLGRGTDHGGCREHLVDVRGVVQRRDEELLVRPRWKLIRPRGERSLQSGGEGKQFGQRSDPGGLLGRPCGRELCDREGIPLGISQETVRRTVGVRPGATSSIS